MIRTLATAFAAASILAVAPAAAQDAPARSVSYADLDLSTAAGQQTLTHRVNTAINAVCPLTGDRSLAAEQDNAKCRSEAKAESKVLIAQVVNNAVRVAARTNGAIQIAAR